MNIINRYNRLSLIEKIGLWGSIASIISFIVIFIPSKDTVNQKSPVDEKNKNILSNYKIGDIHDGKNNINVINGDNNIVQDNRSANLIVNYQEEKISGSKKSYPFFFDSVHIELDKEYIDTILGKPRNSDCEYLGNGFFAEINYKNGSAYRIMVVPTTKQFAKLIDVSRYINGYFDGPKFYFSDLTIGDFLKSQDGNIGDIDSNQAEAGNMQCINQASYTYKIMAC